MAVRCPVCDEEFSSEQELAAHEHHEMPAAWEESGAGFTCGVCGESFDEEEDLIRHQATSHEGDAGPSAAAGSRGRRGGPRDARPKKRWPQG